MPAKNPSKTSRRLVSVLNAKYEDEQYPVSVLDYARSELTDENGEPLSDRQITKEALKAWGRELERNGYQPPAPQQLAPSLPPPVVSNLSEQIGNELLPRVKDVLMEMLNKMDFSPRFKPAQMAHTRHADEYNKRISLSNIMQESARLDTADEDFE